MTRQYVARSGAVIRLPQIDPARVAAAYSNKHRRAPREVNRALPDATSPEACPRCGIRGTKGCAHQNAYVAPPMQVARSFPSHKFQGNHNG